MKNMLKTIKTRLEAGEALVLVTVIASSGATPRGAGARMLVAKEGRICGTIGGGAVEYAAIRQAKDVTEPMIRDYDLSDKDKVELGMICGGRNRVLFIPI